MLAGTADGRMYLELREVLKDRHTFRPLPTHDSTQPVTKKTREELMAMLRKGLSYDTDDDAEGEDDPEVPGPSSTRANAPDPVELLHRSTVCLLCPRLSPLSDLTHPLPSTLPRPSVIRDLPFATRTAHRPMITLLPELRPSPVHPSRKVPPVVKEKRGNERTSARSFLKGLQYISRVCRSRRPRCRSQQRRSRR